MDFIDVFYNFIQILSAYCGFGVRAEQRKIQSKRHEKWTAKIHKNRKIYLKQPKYILFYVSFMENFRELPIITV